MRPAARLLSHQMAAAILLFAPGEWWGQRGVCASASPYGQVSRSPCPELRMHGVDVDEGAHNNTQCLGMGGAEHKLPYELSTSCHTRQAVLHPQVGTNIYSLYQAVLVNV